MSTKWFSTDITNPTKTIKHQTTTENGAMKIDVESVDLGCRKRNKTLKLCRKSIIFSRSSNLMTLLYIHTVCNNLRLFAQTLHIYPLPIAHPICICQLLTDWLSPALRSKCRSISMLPKLPNDESPLWNWTFPLDVDRFDSCFCLNCPSVCSRLNLNVPLGWCWVEVLESEFWEMVKCLLNTNLESIFFAILRQDLMKLFLHFYYLHFLSIMVKYNSPLSQTKKSLRPDHCVSLFSFSFQSFSGQSSDSSFRLRQFSNYYAWHG